MQQNKKYFERGGGLLLGREFDTLMAIKREPADGPTGSLF